MLTASQLFEAGQLHEAIASLNQELRAQPLDSGRRYLLAELLCFTGDWERADKQLDMLAHQDPQTLPGVVLFRQLLRAAQARQQFFTEGRLPEFLRAPSPHLQRYLKASINIREGREQEAAELLAQAESQRQPSPGTCNGQPFNDFRDLDDLTANVLEVLTGAGQYYWIPLEGVVSIRMQAPARPRDLLWRPAHVVIQGGPDSDMFLPVIYPRSEESEEALGLGRTTEWRGGEGTPVRGLGQRMFLVGNEALAMLDIQELKLSGSQA